MINQLKINFDQHKGGILQINEKVHKNIDIQNVYSIGSLKMVYACYNITTLILYRMH